MHSILDTGYASSADHLQEREGLPHNDNVMPSLPPKTQNVIHILPASNYAFVWWSLARTRLEATQPGWRNKSSTRM
ncbi:hypothetical protein GYH30_041692 [Glycine max]|nr:hypothetical protein GYH30_041692 [Glycine max]